MSKMTDKEIIQALGFCSKSGWLNDCDGCPCYDEKEDIQTSECQERIMKNALDLINRQQAEIERLTIEYAGFQTGVKQFAKDGKKVETEAFTDFMVRLKRKIDFYRECDNLDRISVLCHLEQDMHNLVKEMVGEGK